MPASGRDLAKATDTALSNPEVKNLIFGEVIHSDNTFFRHFTSVEHMDSLKKNGVTEIALELPAFLQHTIEALNSGRMTPERFKSNMKAQYEFFDMDDATANERRTLIVDMIQRAHERGIKIQFVDELKGAQEMLEFKKPEVITKLQECAQNKMGAMTTVELENFAKNISVNINKMAEQCINGTPELKAIGDKFARERFETDRQHGSDAAARNPNGRTVFFYGNAHGADIARGHPGKSEGIAGVFDQNTEGVRKLTPFFKYHFNIESGEVTTPNWLQRLLGAAPAPAFAPVA